MSDFPGQSV